MLPPWTPFRPALNPAQPVVTDAHGDITHWRSESIYARSEG